MVMRFIAGAVCPACGEQDSLRAEVTAEADEQYRECVSCGFSETAAEAQTQSTPATRVSDTTDSEGRQAIRILSDPGSRRR